MEDYLERLQEDHGRMVALQAMCESVGRNNSEVIEWSSNQRSGALQVAFSAMFFELIITINRLLEIQKTPVNIEKESISFDGFLKQSFIPDQIRKEFHPLLEELRITAKNKQIHLLRNKVFAHNNKTRLDLSGEIAGVYELCDELTDYIRNLGNALNLEIHADMDNYSYWRNEGLNFWHD